MKSNKKKKVVVAVSGGFDPIHIGHIRMFQEAKKLGTHLLVIINNDNWLQKKKIHSFMPDAERKAVIAALKPVDKVVLTEHKKNPSDMSVCAELIKYKPDIFANGGDRKKSNIPEVPVCKKIGCKMVFGVGKGGKVQSSSWLLEKYVKKASDKSEERPWGKFEVFTEAFNYKAKRLTIFPGAKLSLQSHKKRSEHWVVVEGTAKIINGENILTLHENESTYVPAKTIHQVQNPTKENLEIIEVQTGDYFGEDDIVRYEDMYGRKTA
jgi:cytidyltransferase-like protein